MGEGPGLATSAFSPLPAPRCCHAHDCCYQKLFDLGCHTYVDHYDYTIENDTDIVCSECPPSPLPQEKPELPAIPLACAGGRAANEMQEVPVTLNFR